MDHHRVRRVHHGHDVACAAAQRRERAQGRHARADRRMNEAYARLSGDGNLAIRPGSLGASAG
ncbi:hypothetical protein BCAR13_390011 [Paraburkholderia caribensis]|nr:hypothetical protein BCAR13_390011 [Paraburkholderia caribensis]